jgi:hypothetical protein
MQFVVEHLLACAADTGGAGKLAAGCCRTGLTHFALRHVCCVCRGCLTTQMRQTCNSCLQVVGVA